MLRFHRVAYRCSELGPTCVETTRNEVIGYNDCRVGSVAAQCASLPTRLGPTGIRLPSQKTMDASSLNAPIDSSKTARNRSSRDGFVAFEGSTSP